MLRPIRQIRFGVRTLLFVVTVVAILLGLFATIAKWQSTNQREHEGQWVVIFLAAGIRWQAPSS